MIAFERIEILKDGATALYGSEAVAGVVNFITRSSFEGFDLELGAARQRRPPATGRRDQRPLGRAATTHARARRVQPPRPRAADDLRAPAVGPDRRLEPSRQPRLVPRAVAARQSRRIAPCGRPRSTATATASPTSSSRRSACPPCPARSRPCSPIRTAPRSRRRIPRSCPESCRRCRARSARFRSAFASSTSATSTRSCPRRRAAARSSRSRTSSATRCKAGSRRTSPTTRRCATTRRRSRSRRFRRSPRRHPDNPYGSDVRFIGRIIGAGGTPIESVAQLRHAALRGLAHRHRSTTRGSGRSALQHSENDFFVSAPDVLVDRFNTAIRGFGGAGCNPATGTPRRRTVRLLQPVRHARSRARARATAPRCSTTWSASRRFDAHSELTSLEGFVSRELGELGGGYAGLAVGAQYRGDELTYDYDDEREPRQLPVPDRQPGLRRRPRRRAPSSSSSRCRSRRR